MVNNVLPSDDLRSLAARKKKPYDEKTIPTSDLSKAELEGWNVQRENKKTYRLQRSKNKDRLLEDRVWSLLHRMGFPHMSGSGGASLSLNPKDNKSPKNQIDVVGLDNELALAVECKTAREPKKSAQFQKDIAKHALIRQRFAQAVHKQFPLEHKRVPALAIWTWDLILTENDIQRAHEEKIVLFNEQDLIYYEQLVDHLGPATKYQFFSDILPKRQVYGLEISLPALRSKIGKHIYYTFSIEPEYLLKIAYVSHRAKGKATDIDTYQRMIKKTRLKKIREYISDNGFFPTNIVINLEGKKTVRFDREKNSPQGAQYGTLHLKPTYGGAWIIDGQHRLFAFSGHPRAKTSYLNVLAFEGLHASEQAQFFIDINHEQKSVKRGLLHELFSEINWNAEDEGKRVGAIVSKAIQALNENKDSPLHDRILLSDSVRTNTRCISLDNIFIELQRGLYIVTPNLEYGALWAGDNEKTLRRTIEVVSAWFDFISERAREWWALGSAEGGGLAMNDGVAICVGILRNVFNHISKSTGISLVSVTNSELVQEIKPYGEALGDYFCSFSPEQQQLFRTGARGNQGRTAHRRQCEHALHEVFPDFDLPGLKEDLALQKAQTNQQAYAIIQKIEIELKKVVLDTLTTNFEGDNWWYEGIPQGIRTKAVERMEEEKGKGERQDYLDILDFRRVVLENWQIFQDILAYGSGNKDKRSRWIHQLNSMRKTVMHPAKSQNITWDELATLREYEGWLFARSTEDIQS